MRVLAIVILFFLFGCEHEVYEPSFKALNHGDCCKLLDIMNGDPDPNGCWYLASTPTGSAITQADLDGNDNPEICLDIDGTYVFEYSAACCPGCTKATLTINHGSPCNDPTVTIAAQCN